MIKIINKYLFSLGIATIFTGLAYGQGMAVNASGAAAASSAILDASSTTQGMLIPRMDSTQRATISAPATGLLVYQTNGLTPGFYFYTGSAWTSLNAYTNVTTQGNTFNGPSQLIKANSSGIVPTANLGTGTAGITTFLRGDGTWATPSGLDVQSNITSSSGAIVGTTPSVPIPLVPATSAFSNSFSYGDFIVTTRALICLFYKQSIIILHPLLLPHTFT